MEAKSFDTAHSETTRFVVTPDEKNMAVMCHVAGFAGLVIPFGNIAGPLAVWLLKRDGMPFVDDQGKEAVNFQLTMTIAFVVAALAILLLVGFLLLPVLAVYWLVVMIIAAVRTSEGKVYRYPFTIRFIS